MNKRIKNKPKLQIANFIFILIRRWKNTTIVRKHYGMNFGWKLVNAVNGELIPTIMQETFDSSYALCIMHYTFDSSFDYNNGAKPDPAQEKSVQHRNSVGNSDKLPRLPFSYIKHS